MGAHNASKGYIALGKQSSPTTAVIPAVYAPYYRQSLQSDYHLISDEPIYGTKFRRLMQLQGIRSHGGSVTAMAEPNTMGYWLDMAANKLSTSGSNPYTHTFGSSIAADPNFYTVDISLGSYVERFIGVGASKIAFSFDGEEMRVEADVSGLASFTGAEIASISTSTLTLKTDKDPSPTTGLVANDLVRVIKSDGTFTNYTISSITNATTVVLSATAASYTAGDMLVLRPATPSLTILTPFTWAKTQFKFGANATAAASATHTPLESGSMITLMHPFIEAEGAKTSGALDPSRLDRGVYDLEFKSKVHLDNPDKVKAWNAVSKQAVVMSAFSGASNQYELRITLNDIRATTNDRPTEFDSIIYHEYTYLPNYDISDGQAFDIKVINAISTI